ncbi:hypothetical protein Tco_0471860 [Tanacetum coccineum]
MDEETSLQMDEEELKKLNEVIVEEVTVMEEVTGEISLFLESHEIQVESHEIQSESLYVVIHQRPTLYEQNETPGGSIYWEPHVEGIPIPVEGTYYGTIDEALDMYTKYAEMAGFEVKKEGTKEYQNQSDSTISTFIVTKKVFLKYEFSTLFDPEYNK